MMIKEILLNESDDKDLNNKVFEENKKKKIRYMKNECCDQELDNHYRLVKMKILSLTLSNVFDLTKMLMSIEKTLKLR